MAEKKIKIKLDDLERFEGRKLIIVGFSEACTACADFLHSNGIELYGYASDDTAFVVNKNKNNIIFAEKYLNILDANPIKIFDFYEAIRITEAVFLVASDHYQKLLEESGFAQEIHFMRINN